MMPITHRRAGRSKSAQTTGKVIWISARKKKIIHSPERPQVHLKAKVRSERRYHVMCDVVRFSASELAWRTTLQGNHTIYAEMINLIGSR